MRVVHPPETPSAAAPWLILHAGALGDLALTLRLALRLPGLREAPKLDLLARAELADLRYARPAIRRLPYEGVGLHWLFADGDDPPPAALAAAVGGKSVLSALGGPDTAVHQRLIRLGAADVFSFDPRPDPASTLHITQQWQQRLEAAGLRLVKSKVRTRTAAVDIPSRLRRAGREALLLRRADPAPFVLHPGSGSDAKNWPVERFVEVARWLEDLGFLTRFIVGPVELERWPKARLDELTFSSPLLQPADATELCAMLAAANVVVGNDAGPVHLAALLGTPTVSVFGPTDARVWRPLGFCAEVVTGNAAEPGFGVEARAVAGAAVGCLLKRNRRSTPGPFEP